MTGLRVDARSLSRDVEVSLTVPRGGSLALLGPNGAGKSTALGLISGMLAPDEGTVAFDGSLWSAPGHWVPPHRRPVVQLTQEPLLFPHLTVLANVAFGPRCAGSGRAAAAETARQWLEATGTAHLASRRPSQLSGGQAQRVAIARALATDPQVVLLDEPLSALDADSAPEIRMLLRQVLAGRTTVLVTHDLVEALSLSDRVAVMQDGRVVETGSTTEVLARPRTPFAASLAGWCLLPGTMTADGLRCGDLLVHGSGQLPHGAPGVALFRPAAVAIHAADPGAASPRNRWTAVVDGLEHRAETVRVRVRVGADVISADITAGAAAELQLTPGVSVVAVLKATEVQLLESAPPVADRA